MTTAVAIGFLAVSSVVSAAGGAAAGKANQKIAEQNAKIGRLQAADVIRRGEEETSLIRKQSQLIKGEQTAAFAGQGITLDSDIVEAISINTDLEIENEVATVRNNAAKQAWGLRVGAKQDSFQGQIARRQGISGAAGTLLGGAADIAVVGSRK